MAHVGQNLVYVFQKLTLLPFPLCLRSAKRLRSKWVYLLVHNGKNGFHRRFAFIEWLNGVWTSRDNDVFLKNGCTSCPTFNTCGHSTSVICSAQSTKLGSRNISQRGRIDFNYPYGIDRCQTTEL